MHVLKKVKQHTIKCKVCEEYKPEESFIAKHKGQFRVCKECKTHLNRLNRYFITPDDYQSLLDKQNNKCAICEDDLKQDKNNTVVDHCHSTDEIRGILCRECNSGLGNFKDKNNLLAQAAKYLIAPPARGVVEPAKIKKKYDFMREYHRSKRCNTS
jgi:hypothetical protein